jgi:xeroderma pigmentosum group C-complementing protein
MEVTCDVETLTPADPMTSSEDEDESWEEVQLNNTPAEFNDENADVNKSGLEIIISSTKRKRPSGSTKRDTLARTEVHKTHLLCLLQRAISMNRLSDDEEIQGYALSIVPRDIADRLTAHQDINQFIECFDRLLLPWWMNYVADQCDAPECADNCSLNLLRLCLCKESKFNATTAVLGFIAVCRALNLETRLVCSLQPLPYRAVYLKSHLKCRARCKDSTVNASSSNPYPEVPSSDKAEQKDKGKQRRRSGGKQQPTKIEYSEWWAEIYCPPTGKWLPIDVLRGIANQPTDMEPPSGSDSLQLAYVVAIESVTDYVKDVTRRYSTRFQTHTRKYRMDDWWSAAIERCNPGRPANLQADRQETEDLLRLSSKEALPTSIQAYHNHPIYVLERHLKKFECIYPRTSDVIVGQVRGENIYLRTAIQLLHTKEKWFSLQARVIRRDQLNQPVKIVKSRQQPASSSSSSKRIRRLGGGDDEDEEMAADDFSHILGTVDKSVVGEGQVGLYGHWQTEPYIPAPIVNGIIPKNRYNNIDLFLPSLLPPGAVHITEQSLVASVAGLVGGQRLPDSFRIPSLKRLMRSLQEEVDYAEAVVGFEYHGGRSVPTVDGVVVAEENEQKVRQVFEEQCLNDLSKLLGEREARAVRNWRLLVRKWLIRDRLSTRFNS